MSGVAFIEGCPHVSGGLCPHVRGGLYKGVSSRQR